MKFVARVLLFPVVLLSAFLVLMLKWTLNLAEFGCFLLLTAGTVIVEAVEWFSGWIAEL